MLCNILPEWLYQMLVKNYSLDEVYEIRIRINKPIMINHKGKYLKLEDCRGFQKTTIIGSVELINYVVSVATKQSIYAYNNQIKNCYISTDSGIRIGLCGTVVYDEGNVSTIKNISSLNIRISHEVVNCSEKIINLIAGVNEIKNTLIISPPGAGKTTLVRDVVSKLTNFKINNILVVDERFEIAGLSGLSNFNLGDAVDVISGSEKCFAFDSVLKTMNPSVIVTDEISKEVDIESIKQAVKSGVKVIATAHAKNILDLKTKKYFKLLIDEKYFERIVVLSTRNGVGTIEGVFDENLRGIYLPYILWS